MRTIILIIALLTVLTAGKAQTYSGPYQKVSTDHFSKRSPTDKAGATSTEVTKFKPGTIKVTREIITIDTAIYTVLRHEPIEAADEGYFTESLVVVTTNKKGRYKVYDAVLLLKPNKAIAEVIIKKSKSSNVSYVISE